MCDARIVRIETKLKSACEIKPVCFGTDEHKWELNPPLCVEDLEHFERSHELSLPDGYRQFICRIANGGAGPFYGLEPLHENWLDVKVPSLRADSWMKQIKSEKERPLIERLETILRWARHELSDEFYSPGRPICLAYEGCSFFSLLVTTGEAAGKVLTWDDDGANIFYVADCFLNWY